MKTKLSKVLSVVDDVRSLSRKTSSNAISDSILDLSELLSNKVKWCLCGGLAVGLHSRPRGTDDIDILLSSDSDLMYVYMITSSKFKKASDHMLVHRRTGVAVDLVTPEFIKVNKDVIDRAIDTATLHNINNMTIPAVTREGLVALKLNRAKLLDLADIESIIRSGGDVNLSDYNLTQKQTEYLDRVREEAKK